MGQKAERENPGTGSSWHDLPISPLWLSLILRLTSMQNGTEPSGVKLCFNLTEKVLLDGGLGDVVLRASSSSAFYMCLWSLLCEVYQGSSNTLVKTDVNAE